MCTDANEVELDGCSAHSTTAFAGRLYPRENIASEESALMRTGEYTQRSYRGEGSASEVSSPI
jgi:hypothetical protein